MASTTVRGGTWTYTPSATPTSRDKVRKRIGDVNSANPKLADEEIDGTLADQTDVLLAAAECAQLIAGLYADQADVSNGAISVSAAKRSERFAALAKEIRAERTQNAMASATFRVGGQTLAEATRLNSDSSLVQPLFRTHQDDNPQIRNIDNLQRSPS